MDIRHTLRRMTGVLLAALQLCSFVPPALATSVNNVSVTAASLESNSSAINGMVRVYLSSMGSPTTLNLTIAGSYSVNGDVSQSLSSGSTATVNFDSSTGAITLTYNGVRTNMGRYFALRRHSTSGSNGIKISQAKVSANPYPGDLSFRAVQQSSGSYKLYTVAHIYIENYLYGVLPYEMGNSSNIEALKAQAVAARTYTVRMMQSRTSGYYDVVDTTNDQVYRGTPSGNANCVAAVDATKGIVLKNGSSYTMTYYSASNGGQTESVKNAWGTSGYDYLLVKDDPFDYANPSSTVKSKTVYTNLTSSSNPSGLINLLKSKAISVLNSSGYSANSSNTILQTLKSVTPHTPKFASPSRLYTKMDFAMTAQVGGSTANVTVTCDIFSELESLLSMGIQSSKNELWSVVKGSSSFTLQARRYGHGLGMSQRGAMHMGKLGYTYDQILGFYYNNCKRVRQSFTNTILSAGSSSEQTTIEDAANLPDDTATCKGTVKLVSSGASLAIRTAKSTTASMIGTLGNGAIVQVLVNDGTWCYIQYGSLKGYVPANALSISGTPSGTEGEISSILGFATVTASDYVNLRQSATTSSTALGTAPNGSVLTVFSTSGGWAHVQYCSTVAYVNMSFISQVSSSYPSSVVSTGSATATVNTEDGTGSVNLRATASTGGTVLGQVPHGAQVTVATDDGSWASVSYNGITGYMMSSYLSYDGESLDNNNNNADSNGSTDGSQASLTATVSADITYLREQASVDTASRLMLAKGDTVTVTQKGDIWCAATSGEVSGYILTADLSFSGSAAATVGKAVVTTASGSLNMRAEARAGSQVLIQIPRNMEIDVTQMGSTWCGVRYNGLNGYVMTSFLTFTQGGESSGGSSTPSTGEATAMVTTQSGSLNLRAEARSGSTILRTIPQYATVRVHTQASDWCQVTYMETTGYVMTVFLTITNPGDTTPTETPAVTVTPNPSASPGTETVTPEPSVTPAPTDDKNLYATVTTASGSLNLRISAMPGSAVLTRIPRGTRLVISQKLAAWSQTTYAGQTGYVMNSYLTFSEGSSSGALTGDVAMVTTVSGSLNMRAAPNAYANVLTTIPQYASVSITQRGDEWCSLTYNGMTGYVMTRFLTFSAATTATPAPSVTPSQSVLPSPAPGEVTATPSPSPTPAPTAQTATVNTASGSLNLRISAQSGAYILTKIPQYATVTVNTRANDWCQVVYNGLTGYVMTQYLSFSSSSTSGAAATATPAAASEGTDAWVLTGSGALNLRVSPSNYADVTMGIPRLARLTVLSQEGAWAYVNYNGNTGYVMNTYLTWQKPDGADINTPTPTPASTPSPASGSSAGDPTPSPSPSPTPMPTVHQLTLDSTLRAVTAQTYAVITPREDQSSLMAWSECLEGSVGISNLPRDSVVEVLQTGDQWCQVRFMEQNQMKTGYCLTIFLNIQEPV